MVFKKINELKVSELKHELEERDKETSGQKTVLQQRLIEALQEAGEDPADFLFEVEDNLNAALRKLQEELAENSRKSEESSRTLKEELAENSRKSEENSRKMEEKLEESSRTLKEELIDKFAENSRKMEEKLEENSKSLREEFAENSRKSEENSRKLQEEVAENSRKIEEDLRNELSEKWRDYESQLKVIQQKFDQLNPSIKENSNNTESADNKFSLTEFNPATRICIKPPKFDGKMQWETFLRQFEAAAEANGWTPAIKATQLTVALRGEASDVINLIPVEASRDYAELVRKLEMRFGQVHLQSLHRIELTNRQQKTSETIQEYAADVARLTRLAFPTADETMSNAISVNTFINGLREKDIQRKLKEIDPQTLTSAMGEALKQEAIQRSSEKPARLRVVQEETGNLEETVRRLVREMSDKKRNLRCWNCDELGHLRRNCKKASEQPNKSNVEDKETPVRRITVTDEEWLPANCQQDQEDDPDLIQVRKWKLTGNKPSWAEVAPFSQPIKSYWAQWESIILEDGLLKRVVESQDGMECRTQLIVPRTRVTEVLRQLHDGSSGGHFGVNKTLEKVRQRFYWVNYKGDVKEWCRKCVTCSASNGPHKRPRAPMRQYNVGSPFERVAIDIAGPFPESETGNKYILVAMDYFTKWVEAYALPNQEAVTVAEVLVKQLISRFGVPMELHSDQGRNFESAIFQNICVLLGIHKTRTTPLHPQSDGMVERMNRTMLKHLSKMVSEHQRDWDGHLPLFLMAYRASVHETTGESPANVLFGRELRLPCDLKFGCKPGEDLAGQDYISDLRRRLNNIHQRVRNNIQDASDRMKDHYDIRADEKVYDSGDLVWLHNPKRRRGYSPKLQQDWEGPYEVITKINNVVYRIKRIPNGKPKVVHFNRLAPYAGDNNEEHQSFTKFMSKYGGTRAARFGVTTERVQDLFQVEQQYSVAHCVAADLKMSRGIAVTFRRQFGKLPELRQQKPSVGKALMLKDKQRFLYYLITKEESSQKPEYSSLWEALIDMRKHLLRNGIRKLAIPKLGCGLDGLNWRVVRSMIEVIFRNTNIEILVCSLPPEHPAATARTIDCYFHRTTGCNKGAACRFRHSPCKEHYGIFRDRIFLRRGQCDESNIRETSRAALSTSRTISPRITVRNRRNIPKPPEHSGNQPVAYIRSDAAH